MRQLQACLYYRVNGNVPELAVVPANDRAEAQTTIESEIGCDISLTDMIGIKAPDSTAIVVGSQGGIFAQEMQEWHG